MQSKILKPLWQTIALGSVAGMRTMSAVAIASHILSKQTSGHLAKSPLDFMQSKTTATVFTVLAAGEIITDKLPSTPNRTEPIGVAFRCLAGSLAGAAIYKASGNNLIQGAVIGSVTAFGATFGSYLLRKNTVDRLNLIDPWIGAIEDIVVIGTGIAMIAAE